MLSRTAACLYWMGRYMERAENLARVLEVGYRMDQMPSRAHKDGNEWDSLIVAAACDEGFREQYDDANLETVVSYLGMDEANPSSIRGCLEIARTNARAVRPALTTEIWESLNDSWLEFNSKWQHSLKERNLLDFLDWVKTRTMIFRGAMHGNMLRDEAYSFINLGTYVERADNTARILDVKYHILLPAGEQVGGSVDYYQWSTILRSVSALGSYHWLYRDAIRPWMVAELLILRNEMPRSLVYTLSQVVKSLETTSRRQQIGGESLRLSGRLHSQLSYSKVEDVFAVGLHEYLTRFLEQNNLLADAIAEEYHFYL
ncbi:MAG: hypothetical protein CMF31_07820 [Kordiimonas sp.]|nr:hypothetical protein [Kordiimonas sp.]